MANQNKNPRNSGSSLFRRLTRLFSGPIVNRRQQQTRALKRRQLVKYDIKSTSGQEFKKTYYDSFKNMNAGLLVGQQRAERYYDFNTMEVYPEINSALDLYADEMTTSSHLQPLLAITCANEEIKEVLTQLYHNILNIEFNLFGWCRTMCKFGDFFLYLDIDEEMGVKHATGLPPEEIDRLEGEDKTNPNYVQFQWNAAGITLENWQVAHFRILGNDKYAPFGTSVLDGARRIYRQLCYAKGTRVWTTSGYKEIQEIKPGEDVFSYDTKEDKIIQTKVKNVAFMGNQEVVSVNSRHRKILVTPNHGMYVYSPAMGKVVKKMAKELLCSNGEGGDAYRNCDKLILPVNLGGEEKYCHFLSEGKAKYSVKMKEGRGLSDISTSFIRENVDKNYKNIWSFLSGKYERKIPYKDFCLIKEHYKLTDEDVDFYFYGSKKKSFIKTIREDFFEVDKKFARFFGFMLGDGWTKNNGFGFALGVEEEQNKYYIQMVNELFGGLEGFITNKKGALSAQINFSSKEAEKLMIDLGFKTGFKNKRIPSWVYKLSLEARREFVKGIFDADGCYSNSLMTLSNHGLMTDLQVLCQQSGIPVGQIRVDRAEGEYFSKSFDKVVYRQTSYAMYINMDVEKWRNEGYYLEGVTRVLQEESPVETYDLEVEHECHNFTSEGVVASNTLLEDAMMAYRIVRSSERRVFYIDVGSIPPNEVEQYMQQVMTTMKRNQIADPATGRVDYRYNPLSTEEDYYLPVRGNISSRIETLPGGSYTGDIDDVKYLRDKLFSALKIPQSYLARDEGGGEDKTTLAQKDIRFARTIQRLQRSVVAELEKIGIIHLYILGYRSEDLVSFKLGLNNPSKLAELQELEHWRTKFDVASAATDGHFSRRWIAKKLFNMSEEEILRNQREMFYDKWLDSQFGAIEEGGGGDFGDMGDGDDFGDIGGDEMDEVEETEDEGDETLLAAPGKRDDEGYLTPGAKGKIYKPVKTDTRNMGARRRGYNSQYSQETGKNTMRNTFKGFSDLKSLSQGIQESTGDYEEQSLLSQNHDIKMLIEGLDNLSKQEDGK
jgi:intein/homing endonuclease